MICFEVLGEPAPKGSMRAMNRKSDGRAMLVPGGTSVNQRKLRVWTQAIRSRVVEMLGEARDPLFVEQSLSVELLFRLPRPASVKTPRPMAQKDDVDKLARAVLDALTGVLYDDDGRIAVLRVEKQWSDPLKRGVVISVEQLDPLRLLL